MPPKAVTKFLLTEKTPVSLKRMMCCDVSHRTNWSRHTCPAQKGILLFEDASFTIVHATNNPIATPFLTLEPVEASREILRDHLVPANTCTARPRSVGEGGQGGSQLRGEGAEGSGEEREREMGKEKEKVGVENLASTSKTLLAKLRGEEVQHHGAAYSAQSTDSEPETIPVSGGMADTQYKDGGIPGLESELGDGEGWVVLEKGDEWDVLEYEAEEERGDGEEEGYVDLAGK